MIKKNQSLSRAELLATVLALKPSLAAFDCDGTLWGGDVGVGFFDWEMERGLVSQDVITYMKARYADYRAGLVDEDTMCGEMVSMHRGLKEDVVQQAADEYFEQDGPQHIFAEMQELVRRLQDAGCEVWAVSSSSEWVIRSGMKHFGIPANRILATAVEVENGLITDRFLRIPSGDGKPEAILEVARRKPDAAFGNSRWDAAMLRIARHPFVVNPNRDLEETAHAEGWPVYWPDSTKKQSHG
ncbi:MAG: haloacid dehalogenase-like hydrolase [Acidobacteria bacterium]|nr:haloacid dehalogenase-like hydrolase [Acidobacteriota bacterium]